MSNSILKSYLSDPNADTIDDGVTETEDGVKKGSGAGVLTDFTISLSVDYIGTKLKKLD
jgi:hypothetical protein